MADCPDYGATCLFGAENCLLFILVWFFFQKFCMNPFIPCEDENTIDVHVRRLISGWVSGRLSIKYILIEGACTVH